MKISPFLAVVLLSVSFYSLSFESDIESQSSNSLMSIAIPPEKRPMVSAVLLRCPNDAKKRNIKNENYDEKEHEQQCEEQLIVNIRVNPSFHVEKLEKFLILDEVYDPKRCAKAKIMSPYLIEISRGEPIMMYPLEFSKNVRCQKSQTDKDKCDNDEKESESASCKTEHKTSSCGLKKVKNGKDKGQASKSPEDSSLDRVAQKIASSFSSITGNRKNLAKISKPMHRFSYNQFKQDYSDVEEKKHSDYDDEQSEENSQDNIKDTKKAIDEKPNIERSEMVSNSDINENVHMRDNQNKKRNNLVSVGIDSKFYKDLEKHNIAQIGAAPRYQKAEGDSAVNNEGHKLVPLPVYEAEDARKIHHDRQLKAIPSKTVREFKSKKGPYATKLNSLQSQIAENYMKQTNIQQHPRESDEELKPLIQQEEKHLLEKRGKFLKKKTKQKSPLKENGFRNQNNFRSHIADSSVKYYRPKNKKTFKPSSFKNVQTQNKFEPDLTENFETPELENINDNMNENFNDQTIGLNNYQDINDIDINTFENENEDAVDENLENEEFGVEEHNLDDTFTNYNIQKTLSDKRKIEALPSMDKYEIEHLESLPNSFNQHDNNDFKLDDSVSYEDSVASLLSNDFDDNDVIQESESAVNFMRKIRKPTKMNQNQLTHINSKQNQINGFRGNAMNVNKNSKKSIADYRESKIYEKYNDPMRPVLISNSNPKVNSNINLLNKYQKALKQNFPQHEQQEVKQNVVTNKNRIDTRISNSESRPLFDFYKQMDQLKSLNEDDSDKKLKHNENKPMVHMPSISVIPAVSSLDLSYTDSPPILTYGRDDEILYRRPLVPPRSSALHLINKEPSKYLPQKIPYETIIDDPNLNTVEKMKVLEILNPSSAEQENKDMTIEKKIESDRYKIYTKPYTAGSHHSFAKRSLMAKNPKQKRSFMLYDDLELHNTLDDNDYNFDGMEHKKSLQNSFAMQQLELDNDVQSCSSCGGKNKKPVGKTPNNPSAGDNSCKCRPQRTPQSKDSEQQEKDSISDSWYSVFKMSAPLPFLTTKIRIFRKRQNTWWKIAPSITLNSLSGIFANANLSILFSSHVDIFQLEKALQIQNNKVIIPKNDKPLNTNTSRSGTTSKNIGPSNVFLSDNSVFNDETEIEFRRSRELSNYENVFPNSIWDDNTNVCSEIKKAIKRSNYNNLAPSDGLHVQTIGDLGYFPTSMSILTRCPNDKNRMCLNILDDKVPAFTIKAKIPFRENAILLPDLFKVKITTIITDATTVDTLQVSVDLINEGLISREFSICVCNCPIDCAKSFVKKVLLPHYGHRINFLLPLERESKLKKFQCDVIVKTVITGTLPKCSSKKLFGDTSTRSASTTTSAPKMKISAQKLMHIPETKQQVAIRKMTVDPDNRCFCVWKCECHCVPKQETYVNFSFCRNMSYQDQAKAGLLINCQNSGDGMPYCLDDEPPNFGTNAKKTHLSNENPLYIFLRYALLLLLIMLLLGLFKAIQGRFCCEPSDKFGYRYVELGKSYENSSRWRRFLINTLFFIIFPFLIWCKCFKPSKEDLLIASTEEWPCSQIHLLEGGVDVCACNKDHLQKRKKNNNTLIDSSEYEDDEEVILTQEIKTKSTSNTSTIRSRGGQDLFDIDKKLSDLTLAFHDGVFDDENDENEEANTKFILQALAESRESLKKLLQIEKYTPFAINDTESDLNRLKQAENYVQTLKAAQIVYRTFDQPFDHIRNIPPGRKYCIQGYFLPSLGTGYEFISYVPLAQHRCFTPNGRNLEAVRPPVILSPQKFCRVYENKLEVLDANDLSANVPQDVPCINVISLGIISPSVAKLIAENTTEKMECNALVPFRKVTNPPSISNLLTTQYEPLTSKDIQTKQQIRDDTDTMQSLINFDEDDEKDDEDNNEPNSLNYSTEVTDEDIDLETKKIKKK